MAKLLNKKKKINNSKKTELIPISIKMYKGFKLRCNNGKSRNVNAYWVSTEEPGEDVWIKVVNLDAFKDYDIIGYADVDVCTKVYRYGNIAVVLTTEMIRYEEFVEYSVNSIGDDVISIMKPLGSIEIVISAETKKDPGVTLESSTGFACTDLEIAFKSVSENKKQDDEGDTVDSMVFPKKVFIEDFKMAA